MTILGIVVAIVLQVSMASISIGIENAFDSTFSDLMGSVEITENGTSNYQSQLPFSLVEGIKTSDLSTDISVLSPEIALPSSLMNNYILNGTIDAMTNINFLGVDLASYMAMTTNQFSLSDESSNFTEGLQVIVSSDLYDIDESQFSIGNQLHLMISEVYSLSLSIVGILEQESMIGRMRMGMNEIIILVSQDTAFLIKELVLLDDSTPSASFIHYDSKGINSSQMSIDSISSIDIATTFTDSDKIGEFMDELYVYIALNYGETVEISSTGIFLESFQGNRESITILLEYIGMVSLFIGAITVIISQMVGIEARLKEFAVMKALGWKERYLVFDLVFESVTFSMLGSFIGILLSFAFIDIIGSSLSGRIGPTEGTIIQVSAILNAILIAFGIGLVGGFYPGYVATKADPIEILRSN